MPTITFISADGSEITHDSKIGESIMQVAVKNGVKGIVAECGGSCACATCHVFIEDSMLKQIAQMTDLEDDMLDGAASDRLPNSRLSCQIKMTTDLDGVRVTIAPTQI